jgi:hypothetical protein
MLMPLKDWDGQWYLKDKYMSEFNIKISELNDVNPNPPSTEDFFPLVHSASMTTYKATIQDIGSLITHSIYADTASVALFYPPVISASHANNADKSISASYALTSSYSISASHAILADSASYYPPTQQFQVSCSWASRSLQSWYATRSIDVDTSGVLYDFPYWNTNNIPGSGNGTLNASSPLANSWSVDGGNGGGTVIVAPVSTLYPTYYPFPHFPNYSWTTYNPKANAVLPEIQAGGIQSRFPIVSQHFVGTDQMYYYWTGSNVSASWPIDELSNTIGNNQYFSGSYGNGSFHSIPTPLGGLSSSFNGKWMRIVSYDVNPDSTSPATDALNGHPAAGGMNTNYSYIGGLMRLEARTSTTGSNSYQVIYLLIHTAPWAGGCGAQVLHVNDYGSQIITAMRLHNAPGGTSDPVCSFDLLIGNLALSDTTLNVSCQSWGGVRFLAVPSVGTWPFENTGSNDPHASLALTFPAAPGYYTNTIKTMNYYIQGKNVVIDPTYNEITQSGMTYAPNASPYSLNVSGTVNTNQFYCNNNPGLTTTTHASNDLYFSGGVLIKTTAPAVRAAGPTFISPVIMVNTSTAGTYTYDATLLVAPGTTTILVDGAVTHTYDVGGGQVIINGYPLLGWGSFSDPYSFYGGSQGCFPITNGHVTIVVTRNSTNLNVRLIGYY